MYYIQLLTSSFLTKIYFMKDPLPDVKTEYVTIKDPNGFIQADLRRIEQFLPPIGYKTGDTLEDVAHKQGMHDLYRLIVTKIVGKR